MWQCPRPQPGQAPSCYEFHQTQVARAAAVQIQAEVEVQAQAVAMVPMVEGLVVVGAAAAGLGVIHHQATAHTRASADH